MHVIYLTGVAPQTLTGSTCSPHCSQFWSWEVTYQRDLQLIYLQIIWRIHFQSDDSQYWQRQERYSHALPFLRFCPSLKKTTDDAFKTSCSFFPNLFWSSLMALVNCPHLRHVLASVLIALSKNKYTIRLQMVIIFSNTWKQTVDALLLNSSLNLFLYCALETEERLDTPLITANLSINIVSSVRNIGL